jgi:hypothetical protein
MDGRKDTLTDEALAREIEAALAVEPSPQFVATVRERVSREPLGANVMSWRLWLGGAAVMAGALAVFVWSGGPPATSAPDSRRSPATPAPRLEATARPSEPAEQTLATHPVVATPVRRSTSRDVVRSEPSVEATKEVALPQVLIPENEKRGFELLITELRDTTHAAAVAEATRDLVTPGPPWLEIAPMIIEPLRDVSSVQGEAQ